MADPVAVERRRALGTALWLAGATLLGGIDLPAHGYASFRYAPFGVVAGLLGILYVFVLSNRDVVRLPSGWPRPVLAAYWVVATATVFRVLLPPPGLVQVALAFLAGVGALVVVARSERNAAVATAGVVAIALATIRFALVPMFWNRSSLPDWGPLRLGSAADALRDFFVAYAPQRPTVQALHFAAIACWAAALWTQWGRAPRPVDDPADGSER